MTLRWGRNVILLLALTSASAAASAASFEAPESGPWTIASGNVHPLARPEYDCGRLDGANRLSGISIELAPLPEQSVELATLLAEQQDRTSPNYHKWLTPEQFGQRFGMNPVGLAKLVRWIQGAGLTVTRIARGANEVGIAGTVAQVEKAFHTEIHRYRIDGQEHFAMAREPSIPVEFAGAISGFRGVDDFSPSPLYRAAGQNHVAPGDFATIYGVQKLYDQGIDGSGTTIAIVGVTDYTPSDITTFRQQVGLSPINLQAILVPGSGTTSFIDPNAIQEAELDIQLVSAVARNAKIVYVYTGGAAGYTIRDALKYAIDNRVADIVSNSWGSCEKTFTAAGAAALENQAKQANAQGMTILAGAGDSGAASCDPIGAQAARNGLAVMLPSSLPEVTAVGGTEFNEGAGTYWSATNGANLGSALSYIPEMAWNDTAAQSGLWAGGGGASMLFPKPAWQVGIGVPNDGHRDVPDVAMTASSIHDGLLVYFSPPAATNGTGFYYVQGTSASTPSFAGILALVEQARGKGSLGNVNPMLYALAAQYPMAFHDVTVGDNVVPCQPNSSGCPAAAPYHYGFSAGPGYDLASGLGSVDASALVTAWLLCEASSACSAGSAADGGATDGGAGGLDMGSGVPDGGQAGGMPVGCGCRIAQPRGTSPVELGLLAIGAIWLRRRSRRHAA